MGRESTYTKLDGSIVYLLSNLPSNPTRTKLVKLLYLADMLHSKKYGRTLTGVTYYSYFYGPYSDQIIKSIKKLKDSDIIEEHGGVGVEGQEYYLYTFRIDAEFPETLLGGSEKKTLDKVITNYGDRALDDILDIVYSTKPFVKTKKGQRILLE
jgi:uncharacterized protein YwgA